MKNIVMGIDPGLYKNGYAFLKTENGKFNLVDAGVVLTPRSYELGKRLLLIYESFTELLVSYKPSYVFIEKLFFSKNVSSALQVSQAIGVIHLLLTQKEIPFFEITPVEVKKYVVGDYRADKDSVKKSILYSLGLGNISGLKDVTDAMGIALSGWFKQREESYV
jgi:crossover junction endodeoxyribonuclease RuvC